MVSVPAMPRRMHRSNSRLYSRRIFTAVGAATSIGLCVTLWPASVKSSPHRYPRTGGHRMSMPVSMCFRNMEAMVLFRLNAAMPQRGVRILCPEEHFPETLLPPTPDSSRVIRLGMKLLSKLLLEYHQSQSRVVLILAFD